VVDDSGRVENFHNGSEPTSELELENRCTRRILEDCAPKIIAQHAYAKISFTFSLTCWLRDGFK
jgi:hypothetical protein